MAQGSAAPAPRPTDAPPAAPAPQTAGLAASAIASGREGVTDGWGASGMAQDSAARFAP